MKIYTAVITVLLAFAFLACSAPATKETGEKTDPAKTEKKEAPDTKPAEETKASGMSSPKETITKFVAGIQKKDGAMIKSCLSKASVEQFEKDLKASGSENDKKSIEELLVETFEDEDLQKAPEMKNEKIDGDEATLDVKDDETEKWDSIPFVKEDGAWKIAFDKIKI
ncbi:MAG: DUF4878 domain-containing protein [Pyrinomonadaceae bacterium]|nr:DUF4878 domain-containing protein [Pyrinomonadaceae bacterium]